MTSFPIMDVSTAVGSPEASGPRRGVAYTAAWTCLSALSCSGPTARGVRGTFLSPVNRPGRVWYRPWSTPHGAPFFEGDSHSTTIGFPHSDPKLSGSPPLGRPTLAPVGPHPGGQARTPVSIRAGPTLPWLDGGKWECHPGGVLVVLQTTGPDY